jgi:hypothetical protein
MMVVFFSRNVSQLFLSLGMVLTITVMAVLTRTPVINSQVNLYFGDISVNGLKHFPGHKNMKRNLKMLVRIFLLVIHF